jgi:molybdopterin-containing oxidoreductase family membrane subunit
MLLAGLATPLVLSVHTIVSMDFATSILPGWHTTIFPPYFVAGAVFSGFAMVLTLMIIARKVMKWEHLITIRHLENMTKVIIVTGGIVGLAYGTEFFMAWYSGNPYEAFTFKNRAFGPYGWAYWTMVSCNVISPQLFWFKKIRTNPILILIIALVINVGMWFERFVIIVTSLHRDYLPSSWAMYKPTLIEIGILIGSFGLFFTLFMLFTRVLPMVSIGEVKGVLGYAKHKRTAKTAEKDAKSKEVAA